MTTTDICNKFLMPLTVEKAPAFVQLPPAFAAAADA